MTDTNAELVERLVFIVRAWSGWSDTAAKNLVDEILTALDLDGLLAKERAAGYREGYDARISFEHLRGTTHEYLADSDGEQDYG